TQRHGRFVKPHRIGRTARGLGQRREKCVHHERNGEGKGGNAAYDKNTLELRHGALNPVRLSFLPTLSSTLSPEPSKAAPRLQGSTRCRDTPSFDTKL